MNQRKIAEPVSHEPEPGFLGEGHLAAAVFSGRSLGETDPFIMLMDDRLDLPGGPPVGGAHPHAGFEIATLILEGNTDSWRAGGFELLTTGRGMVHAEEITQKTRLRILQLWFVLPAADMWVEPSWQQLSPENVPAVKTADAEIRIYSGTSNGVRSPVRNRTPVTIAEFKLAQGATAGQEIPAHYNGFVYAIDGQIGIGGSVLVAGQSAWLAPAADISENGIQFQAGENGARFVFYAGAPQRTPLVSYGPFIGRTREDIQRLYGEYRAGKMPHLEHLPEGSKTIYRRAGAF